MSAKRHSAFRIGALTLFTVLMLSGTTWPARAAAAEEEGAAAAAPICGANSPAYPVPEYRGSTRLWPDGFQPARPGQPIPPNRDSTQFVGYPYPSATTGLELFIGLDIVGDRLFVLYNVGLQVWNIGGTRAENPQMLTFEDGLTGRWLAHPGDGEEDGYLFDVAALQDPADPNRIFVTTAGKNEVGVAVWRYDRAENALTPIYQDANQETTDVDMLTVGGRAYALLASIRGAFLVDVSATNDLSAPCLNDHVAITCPEGILLGEIGNADRSRYIGGIERDGSLFVAYSEGAISANGRLPQIWQVDPAQPANATRRFLGSVRDTHSPLLFRKGSRHYMAVVEAKRLRIYDVDACLDADGCTSLPTPSYDAALRNNNWAQDYLTYSESNGTPFLYYGVGTGNLTGTAVERLIDLSNLGRNNRLREITATGETYTDPCNGVGPIGYWADYYPQNHNGLRNFVPGKGHFYNQYFYRATTAVLDVHIRTEIFRDGFESGDLSAWQ